MQHPVVAYIDDFDLICVTITQTDENMTFQPESFRLCDENEQELPVISAEVEPRELHVTGEFFNWKLHPQGKMIWDAESHYYYCELPLKMVNNKTFKFIENGFIWYPHGTNLLVDNQSGDFFCKGYLVINDKVRFILKNMMFGFQSFKVFLKTAQKMMPDHEYFLCYCCKNKIKLLNRDIFNQPGFYMSLFSSLILFLQQ